MKARILCGALAAALCASARVRGQSLQDELDLLARSNVVQGSGARALGMGGAFLARADDATAASWNPAGLSYLKLPEFSLVWAHSNFNARLAPTERSAEPTRDTRSGTAPDFVAVTYPFETGSLSGAAQLSFQRVISFTSNRTIDDPDPQRTATIDSAGGFDSVSLGTGVSLNRKLRVGVVVNHWLNGYRQIIERADRDTPSRQNSDFSLSGWNFHLGLMLTPWENLNLGATFKTGFTSNATLRRSRTDFFDEGETFNAYSARDLRLTLPSALGVGASWRPRSNLTLSLDFTRSFWSNGEIRNFFTLEKKEQDRPAPVPGPGDNYYPRLPWPTLIVDEAQKNTTQMRAGIEYVIVKRRVKWPLRIGYFTSSQYFTAAENKAPSFDGLTAGTGLILWRFLLDAAYVYEYGSYADRDGRTNVVRSHRVYASVIYRYPRKP